MARQSGSFRVRSFVAATAVLSGLSLPMSGIANHLYGHHAVSGARHAWMAAHNVLGLIFVIFTAWHIALNFRALRKHLRGAVARVRLVSKEALLALALVVIALLVSAGHAFHAG